MREIKDQDLTEFTAWYFDNFKCTETPQVYFAISMAGYLHSYEKETRSLLKRCKAMGLVTVANGMVKRIKSHSRREQKNDIRPKSA